MVLGPSPNPCGGTLSRHRMRISPLAPILGERRFGTQMSFPSNGFMVEALAERPASWIKRRFYHPMVLGQLPSAQLSMCRPLIRAQKLRSILRRERLRRLDETLRKPRYLHRVGCGGRNVDQPSTPALCDVRSYSAGDGCELFRWLWNGRLSVIYPTLGSLHYFCADLERYP